MRFIHTADLHLGACPDREFPWGEARKQALWNAFSTIIEAAGEQRVDLLLIAGDLFHRQPLVRECREVNSLFQQIPETRVVLIAGNHDCITPTSPYLTFSWAGNVTILSQETMGSVYFPELHTEVHGFSYTRPIIREAAYDGLAVPEDGRTHILLAHGGDELHIPIHLNDLAAAGFDYVALGHIHQPRLFSKASMAWCGSPEPLDRTDTGRRGYIQGEITEAGCRFHWVPCATTEYRSLILPVDETSTTLALRELLEQKVRQDDFGIYRVTLRGQREPDVSFDLELLRQAGRIVDITDETTPAYDLERLKEEHAHDLISRFIQELTGEESGEKEQMALYFGLQALLEPEG